MNRDNSLLPKYFDLYPQVLPPLTLKMDAILSTPHDYTVRTWCDAIIPLTPGLVQPSSTNYVLTDVRHYKYRLALVQHEYLLLYIFPHAPSSPQPPDPGLRYCMKVSRTIRVDENTSSFLARKGIRGPALDEVNILQPERLEANAQHRHHLISELTWDLAHAPPIAEVSEHLLYISNLKPSYRLLSTQCHFFARAVYDTFKLVYSPTEHRGKKFMRGGHFLLALGAGTSPAIEVSKIMDSVYDTRDTIDQLKAIGDRRVGSQGSGRRLVDKGVGTLPAADREGGPEGSGRRLVGSGVGASPVPAVDGLQQSTSMPAGVFRPVVHVEPMEGHFALDFLARFVEGFRGSISMTITTDM
ncbi:hypothetical protein PAXRUDRAFT_208140 [Paxillus rubicundulus Ve08.2h10]|uniref:Uncharacterized protein n=1 Tax=Paxillus rubicundulus Ve08.2h10 TaxID=930991 RepID=A0A0D0EBH2_9AGAM|nr:hypothetical protein PAXRUDRAFT_208140 [Paxillus rubicundulus Ve08.2h10]